MQTSGVCFFFKKKPVKTCEMANLYWTIKLPVTQNKQTNTSRRESRRKIELLDAVSSNDTSFSIRQQKNVLEKENELQSQQDNKVGWHQSPANGLTNEILTIVPLNSWITKLTVLETVTDNQTTQAEEWINIITQMGLTLFLLV